MQNSTLAIIAGVLVAVIASLVLWRSGRRADAGYLKNEAVSRQWLIEHQSEDRS